MPDATGSRLPLPISDALMLHALGFLAAYKGETRELYTCRLRLWFAWCADRGLDPLLASRLHIELYGRHMEEERGNAPASVHGSLCCLRVFYRLLAVDGVIDSSPAEYVRLPKVWHDDTRVIGLERSDLIRMLIAARGMTPDHAALISMMGMLGLRVTEACNVTIPDFADELRGHRVLRVIGKGAKPATIPIPPAVLREMTRCAEGRDPDGRLLRRIDGVTPLDRRAAHRMTVQVAKRAGIDQQRVTPHVLRHSFVSAGFAAGLSERDMQIAARHSDPRTTVRYDTARRSLDRHAAHTISAYLAGGA